MSNLIITAHRIKVLRTSAVTSFYINQLFSYAKELKRVDGNWYAKNNIQEVNRKALEALSQYNQIRNYYNKLDESQLIKTILDLEKKNNYTTQKFNFEYGGI